MRKSITILCITIAIVFILIESHIIESLVLFLLSGTLPGTTFVVSPSMMMLGLASAAWLAISRITDLDLMHVVFLRRLVKRYSRKRERMPKRRYSRI